MKHFQVKLVFCHFQQTTFDLIIILLFVNIMFTSRNCDHKVFAKEELLIFCAIAIADDDIKQFHQNIRLLNNITLKIQICTVLIPSHLLYFPKKLVAYLTISNSN